MKYEISLNLCKVSKWGLNQADKGVIITTQKKYLSLIKRRRIVVWTVVRVEVEVHIMMDIDLDFISSVYKYAVLYY